MFSIAPGSEEERWMRPVDEASVARPAVSVAAPAPAVSVAGWMRPVDEASVPRMVNEAPGSREEPQPWSSHVWQCPAEAAGSHAWQWSTEKQAAGRGSGLYHAGTGGTEQAEERASGSGSALTGMYQRRSEEVGPAPADPWLSMVPSVPIDSVSDDGHLLTHHITSGHQWDIRPWWRSADQRPLSKYGRMPDKVHAPECMVSIPWPGPWWDTFPAKGMPNDWWQCKEEAKRHGAELIVRARDKRNPKLMVLVNDVEVRIRLLELVVESCEARGTDMNQAGAERHVMLHDLPLSGLDHV
jgi:hypothetical protein